MNDDRVIVMANIRASLQKRGVDLTPLPEWDDSLVVSRPAQDYANDLDRFRHKFESAGGIFLAGWESLAAFIAEQRLLKGYVDPVLKDFLPAWPAGVETHFDRERVDDYEFSVTRAAMGIAESGSIVLSEAKTSSRIGALAPWTHIAVLDRSLIVGTIPEAVARLDDDRATVFVTGPSKTADVEGILIKGVHGPGVQVCCVV